jgi:hypothetical protein
VGGRRVAIALLALQLLAATNHAVAAVQTHAMLNAVMSRGQLRLCAVRGRGSSRPTCILAGRFPR